MSEIEKLPKAGWNWWAFLFGPLWYFYKGMFGKGLLLAVVAMLGAFTFGISTLISWIYAGDKGNEDYYVHRKRITRELEG